MAHSADGEKLKIGIKMPDGSEAPACHVRRDIYPDVPQKGYPE
jgi:hypothetical protein